MTYRDHNLKQIREEANTEIAIAKAKIEAWSKVKINQKKDGTDYEKLAQACYNCIVKNAFNDPKYPSISVGYRPKQGPVGSDKIQAYAFLDEIQKGYKNKTSTRDTVRLTAKQLNQKIAERMEELERDIALIDKGLKSLEKDYDTFEQAVALAFKRLRVAQPSNLYYRIRDKAMYWIR